MTRLALRSFQLKMFKAVRDTKAIRFGPLTVFVGNNGSGKSSVVEGIETFRDVVLNGLDAAMNRWRGFEQVWNHASPHTLLTTDTVLLRHTNPVVFQARGSSQGIRYRAAMRINLGEGGNRLFLQDEVCERKGRAFHSRRVRDDEGDVVVQGLWESTSSGGSSSGDEDDSSTSSSSSTSESSGQAREHRLADGESCMTPVLGSFLESWQFLMLDPNKMGAPLTHQRGVRRVRLARDAENIAQYLYEIRELDEAAFRGILDAVRFVLPYLVDLQPMSTSEIERKVYLRMREGAFEVPGWLLSTGTLRVLAILAVLRHPHPPPLLVVEELENGLDPRTLNMVVEEIRAATAAGITQVIATTHSPYLLDLLDLSHIVIVERQDSETVVRRPDEQALAEWSKSFSPGRLYTMGRLTGE